MASKLEYLQRYMSKGSESADKKLKKKKKREKRGQDAGSLRIVDEDHVWEHDAPTRDDIDQKWEDDVANEEAPVMLANDGEEIDPEDMPAIANADDFQDELHGNTGDGERPRGGGDAGDLSPPRRRPAGEPTGSSTRKYSSDDSPPRRRPQSKGRGYSSDEEGDASPPRRPASRRPAASDDASPPRRRPRRDDEDASPPRRAKKEKDEDSSPPRRRARLPSDDVSPPRRKAARVDPSDRASRRRTESTERNAARPSAKEQERSRSGSRSRRRHSSSSPTKRRDTSRRSRDPRSPVRRRSRSRSMSRSRSRRRTRGSRRSRSPERRRRGNGSRSPSKRRGRRLSTSRSPRRDPPMDSVTPSPPRKRRSRDQSDHKIAVSSAAIHESNRNPRDPDDKFTPAPAASNAKHETVTNSAMELPTKSKQLDNAKVEDVDAYKPRAGLFTPTEFADDLKRKTAHNDILRGAKAEDMGQNAETVYRDRKGRKLDMLNEMVRQQEILDGKRKQEAKEEYEWGTGKAQKEQQLNQKELLLKMKSTPFARHDDDQELEARRRERVRAFDPINSKVFQDDSLFDDGDEKKRKKKLKKKSKADKHAKPKYSGPPAPSNRFGIQPGYRWDGVVRGTGWEEQLMLRANKQNAASDEAYKYAVADM